MPGTTTHHLTQYRAASGALVFSAGTIQWAWGLDSNHDGDDVQPADPRMRQATANILADMGALPTTLASGLVMPTKSTDTTAPTLDDHPADGQLEPRGRRPRHRQGHRSGRRRPVAGVEVSVDGGATFHPADGRRPCSYTGSLTGTGPDAIQVRATDDSGNIQATRPSSRSPRTCPCSIFGALTPTNTSSRRHSAVTLGTRSRRRRTASSPASGSTRAPATRAPTRARLYSAIRCRCWRTATFANETSTAGRPSTSRPRCRSSPADLRRRVLRAQRPLRRRPVLLRLPRLHLRDADRPGGHEQANGVFADGNEFPTRHYKQTNYYVDAVYSAVDTTPLSVVKVDARLTDATSVSIATKLSCDLLPGRRPGQRSSFNVLDTDNAGRAGYDSTTRDRSP